MRGTNTRRDCSATTPRDIRKLHNRNRVYWLLENRSPTSVYMQYDTAARSDGSEGIEIVAGAKYELWDKFAPNNDVIWLTGSNGATLQQVLLTEGYEGD
jgi:hypothetical protein